ncbi:MAG: hypothetical protein Q8Q12_13915 [bacterium]|nr:hypothetical protein [bacterium]
MRLAKARLVISLIIAVAIVTFVYFSTPRTKVNLSFYGGEDRLSFSAWALILLSMGVGFVLGYLFRITRFFVKKTPRHPEE